MGMDWLKGLVGSTDQMVPAGQPIPGAAPYGAPQYGQYAPPGGQPQYGAPPQQFGAPPQPQYAPPGAPPFGAQQQPFGAPPQPQYAPPQQFGAPPPTGWGAAPPSAAAAPPAAAPEAPAPAWVPPTDPSTWGAGLVTSAAAPVATPPGGHFEPIVTGAPGAVAPPPVAAAPPPVAPPPLAPPPMVAPPMVAGSDARVAQLEAQCAELRRDVDSIALFAKTLLALLEEKQVVTEAQFIETKRRLDLLDGKLDDRMGPPAPTPAS